MNGVTDCVPFVFVTKASPVALILPVTALNSKAGLSYFVSSSPHEK